jgi:site-specific DNA recombinase
MKLYQIYVPNTEDLQPGPIVEEEGKTKVSCRSLFGGQPSWDHRRDTWECVRLKLERQKAYYRGHHITVYYQHSEENPLSGRITCSICGSTFMLLRSKLVGNTGLAYWRCSSFRGKRGVAIAGRTFTPPSMPLRLKGAVPQCVEVRRAKEKKLPVPRQMLCTDIRVPAEEADKAFMRAWNFLVSHGLRYGSSFREMARDGKDELIRYRAREMAKLLEKGRIREVDYELMMRVLSHIEVTVVGRLAVIFLTGTRVTV